VTRRKRHPLRVAEDLVGKAGKYLGLYGTVVRMSQLAPMAVGLAIVFFSPTAWLSGTLRQWALGGVIVGSVAGAAALARYRARVEDQHEFAAGLLLLAVVAAAALRFHLAVVDLGFLARWPFLAPLHDFYLGSDVGERLYNVTTAAWFAAALFLAALGLPLYVRGRALRRRAESERPAAADAARAEEALTTLKDVIASLQATNEALQREHRRLAAQLAERDAAVAARGPGSDVERLGMEPRRRREPPPRRSEEEQR
jgi:hypothetical protein